MSAGLATVIVTHQSASSVRGTLAALTPQMGPGDELVVLDSGSTDGTAAVVREGAPEATVIEPGENVGFAVGCNRGAAATSAPLLLFLNPDARPAPGCLDALRAAAGARPGWGAWQALVTLPGGQEVNTRGGVVHFLGLAWAGGVGDPVGSVRDDPAEVGFASGAALVIRRELWDELGGFDPSYFMYGEDVDLSLRVRLAGRGVGLVPDARVEHDYEFDKGVGKWFLLERNRWQTVTATYPSRLLIALAPALLAAELGLLAVAAAGGWLPEKLRADGWLLRNAGHLRRRRRAVQARRVASVGDFAAALQAPLDSRYLGAAGRSRLLAGALALYWRAALAMSGARR